MKDKKRFIFLDVLRIIAFFLVFVYHFLVRSAENGILQQEIVIDLYEYPNFHMATLGVSLFFMISGAGLMISAEKEFCLKEYFQKRVIRILLPFYVVYIGVFAAMFIIKKGMVFDSGIPKWHFLFTVAGIDGYLQEFGIATFSLGIGEWFLGSLIMMYLIFPLLRKCMLQSPKLFFGAASLVYLILVNCDLSKIPVHMNFFVKLYEFILGMYLMKYWKIPDKRKAVVVIPVLLLFFLCPVSVPLSTGMKITIVALAAVLLAVQAEPVLDKWKSIQKVVKWFAKYSFEMFLVHHWIIIVMTQYTSKWIQSGISIAVLGVTEILLTILVAMAVKVVAHAIQVWYNNVLKI